MPGGLRIGLQQDAKEIVLSGDGRFDFNLGTKAITRGSAGQTWKVTTTGNGRFRLTRPDGKSWTVGDPSKWVGIRFSEHGTLLRAGGIRYKYGWLELNITSKSGSYVLRSILHVAPFERYILGLGEMPFSWHGEALKAQATAARTYVLEKMRTLGVRSSCNCHIYDDTRDQVYVGYEKEAGTGADRWKAVSAATAGKVILYDGKPIKALYHSADGGHTEHNEFVWGGTPLPYLRGVSDPWDPDESPYQGWTVTFTHSQLQTKLASNSSTDVGTLSAITFLDPKGISGRVGPVLDTTSGGVKIVGSEGTKRVSGTTFRSVLGLRSALFTMRVRTV
jgi:SpoIID/LytB domain protein